MTDRRSSGRPGRIVHLGLGSFSRSHLFWYTQHAGDADAWEIVAYTGRSRELVESLSARGLAYHLVQRGADQDHAERITSLARAHPGDDVEALVADVADPATALVTLTVTEAGYHGDAAGRLDLTHEAIQADLRAVAAAPDACGRTPRLSTAPGRLALALRARRLAGAGPVTVLSCDNMPDNGESARQAVLGFARAAGLDLEEWLEAQVSFASSSVDRITPRISPEDRAELTRTLDDPDAVVAEPFSSWIIAGDFPAGRPQWEDAGAVFVDDLEPWERRKLWMLNGAHTLLATLGRLRGHARVDEAIGDPECRQAVLTFWQEAEHYLPEELEAPDYGVALLERFSNPRIAHRLAQIAENTELKARLRILPVAEREIAAGRSGEAAVRALAACVAAERALGGPPVQGAGAEGDPALRILGEELERSDLGARVQWRAADLVRSHPGATG